MIKLQEAMKVMKKIMKKEVLTRSLRKKVVNHLGRKIKKHMERIQRKTTIQNIHTVRERKGNISENTR